MTGATSLYAIFLFLGALPGLKSASKIPRAFSIQFKAAVDFARSYPLAVTGLLTGWGYAAVACTWPMIRLQGVVLENLDPFWRHSGSILTFWRTTPGMALPVLNNVVFRIKIPIFRKGIESKQKELLFPVVPVYFKNYFSRISFPVQKISNSIFLLR